MRKPLRGWESPRADPGRGFGRPLSSASWRRPQGRGQGRASAASLSRGARRRGGDPRGSLGWGREEAGKSWKSVPSGGSGSREEAARSRGRGPLVGMNPGFYFRGTVEVERLGSRSRESVRNAEERATTPTDKAHEDENPVDLAPSAFDRARLPPLASGLRRDARRDEILSLY